MRSLDEFYRYIEKQEQAALLRSATPGPADAEGEPSAEAEGETGPQAADASLENGETSAAAADAPPVNPLVTMPVAIPPGRRVRYIIRGGMTVAVPVEEDAAAEAKASSSGKTTALLRRGRAGEKREVMDGASAAADVLPEQRQAQVPAPDYLPPLVEGQEPTLVADAPARPRKNGVGPWHRSSRTEEGAASEEPLSDGDAAALWQRIPRHIQLLVSMEEPQEEVAQKYYTRGFKESRRQLIERLLDPTLTLEDTARVLGVCPTTVRRYTNRGLLPHHRTVGQQRRFRLSDVLAFMEQQQKREQDRSAAPTSQPPRSFTFAPTSRDAESADDSDSGDAPDA